MYNKYLNNNTYFKIALYIRLSREDGDDLESESISNQRTLLYEYLKKHQLVCVEEYVDDGYSLKSILKKLKKVAKKVKKVVTTIVKPIVKVATKTVKFVKALAKSIVKTAKSDIKYYKKTFVAEVGNTAGANARADSSTNVQAVLSIGTGVSNGSLVSVIHANKGFKIFGFGYSDDISCIEENEKAFPYCAVINDHKITYTENYRKIQTISVPFVSFNSDGTVFIGFEDNFTEQFGFYYKFGMEVDDFKKWLTW